MPKRLFILSTQHLAALNESISLQSLAARQFSWSPFIWRVSVAFRMGRFGVLLLENADFFQGHRGYKYPDTVNLNEGRIGTKGSGSRIRKDRLHRILLKINIVLGKYNFKLC